MQTMRTSIAIFIVAFLIVGCSQIAAIGDWVNDNPFAADIAIRQATVRYIDQADEGKQDRADSIVRVADTAEAYIDGDLSATVAELLNVVDESIDWQGMSTADRLLVQDLLSIVQLQLADKQDEGNLDENAKIGLRSMLNTIRSAAGLFRE